MEPEYEQKLKQLSPERLEVIKKLIDELYRREHIKLVVVNEPGDPTKGAQQDDDKATTQTI